jgi:hypothetical protein
MFVGNFFPPGSGIRIHSIGFRCSTWQRPPGAAAVDGRSDIWRRIPRRIPPGPTSRGQRSTPLSAPPPEHVMNQLVRKYGVG